MQITEVQLACVDPVAAGRRYADLLRLPVSEAAEGVEVQAGSTRLVLVPGSTGPGVHHLAFTVPSGWFDEAVDRLTAQVRLLSFEGRTVFEGPPHWNSASVYFPGPDGAVLEYIVRRDLPDEPLAAQAVPGSSIAAISEVGIAASDVPVLGEELQAQFGLKPFGPPFPDFAPTGDQHGLLICVTPHRPWAPEGKQLSHGGPLRVVMTTPRGRGELVLDAGLHHQLALR